SLLAGSSNLTAILPGAVLFAACNIVDAIWGAWMPIELMVLLLVFALGIWLLHRSTDNLAQEIP
ncbi:MAG: hypothetical protein ABR907_05915, partial [Terracidiphilus sp.]